MVDKVFIPWDLKTVKALNLRQRDNTKHPYTCDWHNDVALIPTYVGWVCIINGCDYYQDWALTIDVDEYEIGDR